MSIIGIEDAVLAAVVSVLKGNAPLVAAVAGIYDEVPQPLAFPYIQLGDSMVSKDATFDQDGRNVLLTLHVWSQYAGAKEASTIMGMIGDLLDEQPLTVAGGVAQSVEVESSQVMRDIDGRTRHGVMQLRVLVAAA